MYLETKFIICNNNNNNNNNNALFVLEDTEFLDVLLTFHKCACVRARARACNASQIVTIFRFPQIGTEWFGVY